MKKLSLIILLLIVSVSLCYGNPPFVKDKKEQTAKGYTITVYLVNGTQYFYYIKSKRDYEFHMDYMIITAYDGAVHAIGLYLIDRYYVKPINSKPGFGAR